MVFALWADIKSPKCWDNAAWRSARAAAWGPAGCGARRPLLRRAALAAARRALGSPCKEFLGGELFPPAKKTKSSLQIR